jgi:hypothetical protein
MAFNNGPRLVTQGLNLLVDAGDPTSYPGTGTTWRDVIGGQNGTITGSVSYSSAFYGGLVFSGPTASVIFPTSSANFGTGSFEVELAFQPARIEGIHYLISKNSGSFPNWGVYLSGSGGSGKLFSEFRISSTVSCSISSSSTFVTGSNYDVCVRMLPSLSASIFFIDGTNIGGGLGNGGGSLTSTGSFLIGNIAPSSSQVFSGSLYNTKIYTINTSTQPIQNYNAIASRLSKLPLVSTTPIIDVLVVAGGGGGSYSIGGGGGAGGLLTGSIPLASLSAIIVGGGGAANGSATVNASNGSNSVLGSLIALGGGGAGANSPLSGSNGGSGGGSNLPNGYGSGIAGSGSLGQGNNGSGLGGGGGAGTAAISLNGGSGSYVADFAAIGGSPAGWFAGGGAGGAYSGVSIGGIGGGGSGSISGGPAQPGATNTGGGGGAGFSGGSQPGGSGIVAIRYSGNPIAIGGQITQSAGYTYHVFRTVGTSSFTIF